MELAEVQESVHRGRAANKGAADSLAARDEREDVQCKGFTHNTNKVEMTFRGQGAEVAVPIELYVDGHDNQVEIASHFLELLRVSAGQGLVGAQRLGFFHFLLGGKCGDFTAPSLGKLQREVSKPSNTNNSNLRARSDVAFVQGVEHGNTTAEEGANYGRIHAFRDRDDGGGLGLNLLAKGTFAANDSAYSLRAQILVATQAGATAVAISSLPPVE